MIVSPGHDPNRITQTSGKSIFSFSDKHLTQQTHSSTLNSESVQLWLIGFPLHSVSNARSPPPHCLFFDLPLMSNHGYWLPKTHTHTRVNLCRYTPTHIHDDRLMLTFVFQVTSRSVQYRRCVPSVPVMGWRELTLNLLLLMLVSHLEAVSFPEDNIPLDVVDRHCKTMCTLTSIHMWTMNRSG